MFIAEYQFHKALQNKNQHILMLNVIDIVCLLVLLCILLPI